MDAITAFEGMVTEYNWRNPHVYLLVETTDERGEAVEWEIQMGAVSLSTRRGWASDSLSPGDKVSVRAHAARDGRHYAILESIDTEEGLTLTTNFATPDGTATTETERLLLNKIQTKLQKE